MITNTFPSNALYVLTINLNKFLKTFPKKAFYIIGFLSHCQGQVILLSVCLLADPNFHVKSHNGG